eukprot:m.89445 g.89445  ORF g.89445 m.89445 type:complete len:631 (+) comp14578_c0_seq1:305-2197(+)
MSAHEKKEALPPSTETTAATTSLLVGESEGSDYGTVEDELLKPRSASSNADYESRDSRLHHTNTNNSSTSAASTSYQQYSVQSKHERDGRHASSTVKSIRASDSRNKEFEIEEGESHDEEQKPLPFGYDRRAVEAKHEKKIICCYVPLFVLLCIMLTAMSSVLLGYDIGIMSAAKLQIKNDMQLSDNEVEVMVGILNFVSAFGGLASGKLCDFIGRKATVAVASIVFLAGALLMALSKTYSVLVLGRVVTGLGVGCGLTIAPLYMAELSPAKLRGALVSMNEVSINVGILLGFIAGWAFSSMPDSVGWRWMLGLGALPPVAILATLTCLPESPRWLVKNSRLEEAFKVLLRACSPDEAATTFEALTHESQNKREGNLRDFLCPDRTTFRLVLAGVGVAFFQQATGLEALLYYVPEVLDQAGITEENDQLLANAGIGAVKVAFILVAMKYSDRYGRKKLLILSGLGMLVADVLIATSYLLDDISALTISSICMYMACFSMGWGPVTWVVTSEVFPLHVRGLAAGTATFVNRITSGIIAMTFLSMSKALTGAGAFFLFAGVEFLSIFFVKFFVPETRNKTLEEIERSARKHRMRLPCAACCPSCQGHDDERSYLQFQNDDDRLSGDEAGEHD